MAIHQAFADVLLYGTPSEARIRPFPAGGVNFSNFVPPGQSAQYGHGQTKYGINYSAGIKIKVAGRGKCALMCANSSARPYTLDQKKST